LLFKQGLSAGSRSFLLLTALLPLAHVKDNNELHQNKELDFISSFQKHQVGRRDCFSVESAKYKTAIFQDWFFLISLIFSLIYQKKFFLFKTNYFSLSKKSNN